jgi:predicted amidophosphoribosyltransferase
MLNKNVVNIFEKVKETDHQSHLSRKERLLNLQSSIITKKSYKNAYMSSIIVVDDVFTTGATLSTVAEVSKNDNVANSFIGVTVFRA